MPVQRAAVPEEILIKPGIPRLIDAPVAALDVARAARQFSRAADGYDRAARLQADVRGRLLGLLPDTLRAPARILDLGGGTGLGAQALAARFPDAAIVGLDRAEGMARAARARLPAQAGVVADARCLPFAAASFDLIFSSLMLQWCPDPERALAESRRVLRPGGWLAFSVPGPASLHELRTAWRAVDDCQHVHEFAAPQAWRTALARAGWETLLLDHYLEHYRYPDVMALMQSLRDIGACNASHGRRRALLGKGALARLARAYAPWQTPAGDVRASWQIVLALVRQPA